MKLTWQIWSTVFSLILIHNFSWHSTVWPDVLQIKTYSNKEYYQYYCSSCWLIFVIEQTLNYILILSQFQLLYSLFCILPYYKCLYLINWLPFQPSLTYIGYSPSRWSKIPVTGSTGEGHEHEWLFSVHYYSMWSCTCAVSLTLGKKGE